MVCPKGFEGERIMQLKCPFCKSTQTTVNATRSRKADNSIKRYRECLSCHRKFETIEKICLKNEEK